MTTIDLSKNSTMLQIVMTAFENLGGRATLGRAYLEVGKILRDLGRSAPNELEAEVRKIIYAYCPTSELYKSEGEFFIKCRRGEYQVKRPTLDDLL